jgi:hypothetical protein
MSAPTKRVITTLFYLDMAENEKKHANDALKRRIGSLLISRQFHERMMYLMERRLIGRGVYHFGEKEESDDSDVNSFVGLDDDIGNFDSDCDALTDTPVTTSLGRLPPPRPRVGKGMARVRKQLTPPPSPVIKPLSPQRDHVEPRQIEPKHVEKQVIVKRVDKPKRVVTDPEPKRAKTPRVTKGDYVSYVTILCDRIIPRFNTPESLINVSLDDYRSILAKLQRNLDGVPEPEGNPKSPRITDALAVKHHHFVPRAFTRRLFVEHISRSFEADKSSFNQGCRACSELVTGMYAVSLRCPKTIMHPKCAAVVLDAVSAKAYHRCLTAIYTRDVNGRHRDCAKNCKHIDLTTSTVSDLYKQAMDMATGEEREIQAAEARSDARKRLL